MAIRKSLLALAVSAFGIGTTEYVIMGLLPELAADFHVSIPRAGILVSGYALSVTIGSPILAVMMARMDRKLALMWLMALFLLGNVGCALAPNFQLLLIARIITALCHGTFFGIGSVVASTMVHRSERAQAIALMFSGLTLANVLGVPAGTALGQAFGWRSTFWALIPIGLVAGAGLWSLVPSQMPDRVHVKDEVRTLLKPQVLMVLVLSTISSTSLFAVFTYIAPILRDVTGLSPHAVAIVLVLFGVGITVGNLIGAKLSDWKQLPSFLGCCAVLICLLLVMPMAQRYPLTSIAMVPLWGMVHFAMGSPLQSRVVDQAKGAPNLAATMNQGAYNLGNALGASVGGVALTMGLGYGQLGYLAAAIAGVVLVLGFIELKADRKRPKHTTNSMFVPMGH
jgi:DHA1 family inner membrane transport protein